MGGQEDFFKFTPTVHVYVLRAGIKSGENRPQKKEKHETERNKNEMKPRSHSFVCGSVTTRPNNTLTGCGRRSIPSIRGVCSLSLSRVSFPRACKFD